jgi:tetratricopeptide (TPR) repeat protein
METKTQDNEKLQLLQTVEMFEAVTQANPDDYQSLEILKEAYVKLGRDDDSHRVAKQVALAHYSLGQFAKAIQEHEAILKKWPNDSESKKALKELRERSKDGDAVTQAATPDAIEHLPTNRSTGKDSEELLCDLIVKRASRLKQNLGDPDGDEVLCELIVKHNLLKEKDVMDVLHGVQGQNAQMNSDSIRVHLVQGFSDRGLLSPEQLLAFITEKTTLAYIPLTIYDVVPDIVRLLPRDIAFRHCIIPFDRISRTLLMASANPFDEPAKKAAEKALDYNLQWYVCNPAEITQVLKDVYLIGKASTKDD